MNIVHVTAGLDLTPLQQKTIGDTSKWNNKSIKNIRQEVLQEDGLYDTYKTLLTTVQAQAQKGLNTLEEQKTQVENLQKLSCMKQVFRQLGIREYCGGWFSKIGTYLGILFKEGYKALRACRVVKNDALLQEDEVQERISKTVQKLLQEAGCTPSPVEGRRYTFSYQIPGSRTSQELDLTSPTLDLETSMQGVIQAYKGSVRVHQTQVQETLQKKTHESNADIQSLKDLCQQLNTWAAPWHVGPQRIPSQTYVFHVDQQVGLGERAGHGVGVVARWLFGRPQVPQRAPQPQVSTINWDERTGQFLVKTESIRVTELGKIQIGEGAAKKEFDSLEQAEASLRAGESVPYHTFQSIVENMKRAQEALTAERHTQRNDLARLIGEVRTLANKQEVQNSVLHNTWTLGTSELPGQRKKQEVLFRYDAARGQWKEEPIQIIREGKYVIGESRDPMTFQQLSAKGFRLEHLSAAASTFSDAKEAVFLSIRGASGEDQPRGADATQMLGQVRAIQDDSQKRKKAVGELYRRTDEGHLTYDWLYKKPEVQEVQGYRIQLIIGKDSENRLQSQMVLIPLEISGTTVIPKMEEATICTTLLELRQKLEEITTGLKPEDESYQALSNQSYVNGTAS